MKLKSWGIFEFAWDDDYDWVDDGNFNKIFFSYFCFLVI